MPEIKERISALVRQQLPEFVRSDYQTFVSFLETYYKFLEQDQNAQEIIQNARQYSDIDSTAASFLDYFLKNYGSSIPVSVLSNKTLLIKRLTDLYTAKGSELSYKLLFRILFDADVVLRQPYEYVLRPSDGVWEQRVSIRVRITLGLDQDILNRILLFTKNGITYSASILRVKILSPDLYEIFIRTNSDIPYSISDTVYVQDDGNVIFSGYIEPTPTSYNIIKGGTGFKAGQIFTVNLAGAVNTVIQIRTVDDVGAITSLKFINYGYDFPNEPITIDLYNNLTLASRTLTARSNTGGFRDEFEMLLVYLGMEPGRYFLTDYVEQGYMGELLVQTTTDNTSSGSSSIVSATTDPDVATITFEMGPVSRYPGQYISNKGFPSEPDVRLQDDELYQPFAYQLESDVDITRFYDIVKQLVHPAGTNLFSNRALLSSANVKANVSVVTASNIYTELYTTFFLTEDIQKTLIRTIADSASTNDDDFSILGKLITDSVSELDNNIIRMNKVVGDSIVPTDVTTIQLIASINDNVIPVASNVAKLVNSFIVDFSTPVDNTLLNFNTVFNDLAPPSDNSILSTRPVVTDSVILVDTNSYNAGISLRDTQLSTDSSIFTLNRVVVDSVLAEDNPIVSVGIVDTTLPIDGATFRFNTSTNDNALPVDEDVISFRPAIGDSTGTITDRDDLTVNKNINITATLQESANLFLQNYVETTDYFAENYVGTVTTLI